MLYTTDPIQQDSYVQAARKKDYKVVKLDTIVDAAFINNMEMKWNDMQFVRVDADITENLIDKNENADSVLNKEEEEKWESLGLFVKYGMMTDDKFLEKANKFNVFETSPQPLSEGEGQDAPQQFFTLEEYRTATEALQKIKRASW